MGDPGMKVEDRYIEEHSGSLPQVWNQSRITELLQLYDENQNDFFKSEKVRGLGYGPHDTTLVSNLLGRYKDDLAGKHCAVLGSQSPWVEALLLHHGAAHVTTVEYGSIKSEHPSIT